MLQVSCSKFVSFLTVKNENLLTIDKVTICNAMSSFLDTLYMCEATDKYGYTKITVKK